MHICITRPQWGNGKLLLYGMPHWQSFLPQGHQLHPFLLHSQYHRCWWPGPGFTNQDGVSDHSSQPVTSQEFTWPLIPTIGSFVKYGPGDTRSININSCGIDLVLQEYSRRADVTTDALVHSWLQIISWAFIWLANIYHNLTSVVFVENLLFVLI